MYSIGHQGDRTIRSDREKRNIKGSIRSLKSYIDRRKEGRRAENRGWERVTSSARLFVISLIEEELRSIDVSDNARPKVLPGNVGKLVKGLA